MSFIVSLDPGGQTGLCVNEIGDTEIVAWQLEEEEHHTTLWNTLAARQPLVVVCENFTYRRVSSKGTEHYNVVLKSVEYIGVARLYAQLHNITFRLQMPSHAKNLWTDDKLKKLGLHHKNMPHANDAIRHMLYYLVVERGEQWPVYRLKG